MRWTRRRILGLAASGAALLGGAWQARARAATPYYEGPASDHFDGKRFFNPGGQFPGGFGRLLRWKLTESAEPWPDAVPSPFPADRPPAEAAGGTVRVTLVGHATHLIQVGGLSILTDPVWSDRASPFALVGPRRHNPPGIGFEDLPRIDVVLISHNHYDHLDVVTLARLWERDRPQIVAPLGNDAVVRAEYPGVAVRTVDWGDRLSLGAGAQVSVEPVHHWSARGVSDRNAALWCGYTLEANGRRIFFCGDSGFHEGKPFRAVAERHGPVDLALLPIGAYEPRWFMRPQHMNPDDAVQAFGLLGARQALGYHWNTFRLTNEGPDRPATDLAAALATRGVAASRFVAMRPGQVWRSDEGTAAAGDG